MNRADALRERRAQGHASASRSPSSSAASPPRPEAIYQSLRRRRERLETRLREERLGRRGARGADRPRRCRPRRADDLDDLDDLPDGELEDARGGGRRPGHRPRRRSPSSRPRSRRCAASRRCAERVRRSRHRREVGRARRAAPGQRREMFDADGHAPQADHLHRAPRHAQLPRRARSARCSAAPRRSSTIHGGMRREERREAQERVHAGPGRARSWSPPTPPARASTSSAPT